MDTPTKRARAKTGPKPSKDREIEKLRDQGFGPSAIADSVGLTRIGVIKALKRIASVRAEGAN